MIRPVPPYHLADTSPECLRITSGHPDFESYASYLLDESRLPPGDIDEICLPFSELQIIEILKTANKNHMPVTVSSGRTGIVGGAVPKSGLLLVLDNLNKFHSVEKDPQRGWILSCESGITLNQIEEGLKKGELTFCDENSEDNQHFLSESGLWFYPPDPTERTAHLGGTVATNASGAHSLLYGPTRNHIRGIRIVLADGTLLHIKRGEHVLEQGDSFRIQTNSGSIQLPVPDYPYPDIKNTAGYYSSNPYDLIDLFIGSEGTLGIITGIDIQLTKRPDSVLGCLVFFKEDKVSFDFVSGLKEALNRYGNSLSVSVIEYFGPDALHLIKDKAADSLNLQFPDDTQSAIYIEQPYKEDEIDQIFIDLELLLNQVNISIDDARAAMEPHELKTMSDFRHLVPESINAIIGQRKQRINALHKISTDFVVPDHVLYSHIKAFRKQLSELQLEHVVFGHIGESHLHVNILPRSTEELDTARKVYLAFAEKVIHAGGSISGEHGIGKIKKHLFKIAFPESSLQKMQKIKKILDSNHILNQEVLF